MAKGKEFETIISVAGKVEASLKNSLNDVTQALEKMQDAVKETASVSDKLSIAIDEQSDELKAAKKKYMDYVLAGEEASDEAQELKSHIEKLSSELNSNKSRMKAAADAADALCGEYGDLGNKSKSLKDGFTVMKGAIANLVSAGIQKLISSAGDAVRALFGLSEQTREFRQDMSTLETAYDKVGFSSKTATKTWKDMYAIFGEDDRAVEAANNISRMSKNQQDLDNWVRITTGIWGTYQDALPVEGLAEAAGETAKTGKVTGVMADALNWSSEAASMFAQYMSDDVTTAEDAFNEALSKCTTEQERQALITETLNTLYGDAADKYKETAGAQMQAKEAAAEYMLAQAQIGETMEPLTTAWTNFKTSMLESVAPALETVSEKLQGVLEWMKQHPDVVNAVVTALAVLVAGITAVAIAVAIYTGVQMLANAAMLPVILIALGIVAAIAAVIGICAWLAQNWDMVKQKASEVWQAVQTAWNSIVQAVSGAVQTVVNTVTSVWNSLVGIVSGIWNGIVSTLTVIWNTIKQKVSDMVNTVKTTITNAWSGLTSILTAPFTALKTAIDKAKNAVGGLIEKAKNIKLPSINIPGLATGGFTKGLTFAGEAGTEAVISFDPRYRSENLSYWAKAGRMLGVDLAGFSLSGSSGGNYYDMGGVTFAPNITVTGNTDKQTIMDAIEAEYPEFIDMLEDWWAGRGAPAYG